MGFYIQDDFWEAVEDLSDAEQNAYFGALVRLFFRGEAEEPKQKEVRRLFRLTKARVRGARRKRDTEPDSDKSSNELSNELLNRLSNQLPNQLDMELPNEASNEETLLKSERESKSKGEKVKPIRRFAPPSPPEVDAFAAENELSVDGQQFCDYYAAQGWRLSNGNMMKDWEAAARNWSRRNFRKAKGVTDAGADLLGEYADAF